MFCETLENEYKVVDTGTSEGTQTKYRKGKYWYKMDNHGKEGLTEYLVSKLLTFSDLVPSEYVIYEQGMINGTSGCRSENFLRDGEELITFYRLYYNEFGRDLSKVLAGMDTMEERIEYTVQFVMESCSLDVTDYLRKIFTLDMIVLNEDRHLNNLAVLFSGNHVEAAPVFDNGASLLTANQSVNWNFPMEENVKRVVARPFSGSHEKMFQYFGCGFRLDYPGIEAWLKEEPESRERDVLAYQISKLRGVFETV